MQDNATRYADWAPDAALALFGLVLVIGLIGLAMVYAQRRRLREEAKKATAQRSLEDRTRFQSLRPARWLAIKSTNPMVVQSALGLQNLKPCSWQEGLEQAQDRSILVSPPVDGWILVTGGGVPSPEHDVDACFHLLQRLSRDLGSVQFFSMHPALDHHAWAMAHEGTVVRAYAWSGGTLWNQGNPTPAERQLQLHFADYGERTETLTETQQDQVSANTEKVAKLAAAWSIDPATAMGKLDAERRSVLGHLVSAKNR